MSPSKLYIIITGVIFAILTIVFLAFPRSEYSELEKRELAKFPEFSVEKLKGNAYTSDLSTWFSDSEPFRDEFMAMSMKVKDILRLSMPGEESITYHRQASSEAPEAPGEDATEEEIAEYQNKINAEENAKLAASGVLIVGSGKTLRALPTYGGSANGGTEFAAAVSRYKRELGNVNVYAMVVPNASEFYTPTKAQNASKPQLPTIKNIHAHLKDGARYIDAYTPLAQHVEEEIYLRTDHHWSPLGAYYAAAKLAQTLKVPFKPLSAYDRHVIHGYVGSMYGFSKDIAVKNSPEDFVYYTPKGVSYTTTYSVYSTDKSRGVMREAAPVKGQFFYKFKDGSGAAYTTFMGGDQKLTKVQTNAGTGRKLLIIKDSFGNAVPGYLFHSFDELHVVDFRYFTRNIKKYIKDHGITDVVFCVNIYSAYSGNIARKLEKFLTQPDSSEASVATSAKSAEKKESADTKSDTKTQSPSEDVNVGKRESKEASAAAPVPAAAEVSSEEKSE